MSSMSEHTAHTPVGMTTRVLETIETQHLEPKPRWHFVFREWFIRVVALCAFLLGSFATALTIYIVTASQYMEDHIEISQLDRLSDVVPFLWLILFAVGVFYTIYAVRQTHNGYRYHVSWLVGGALLASIVFGASLHAMGLGESADRFLLTHVPSYRPLAGFRTAHWMDASQGLLVGTIIGIDPEHTAFTLDDLEGNQWTVNFGDTALRGQVALREGSPVRVFGTTTSDGIFQASDIRPFVGRGGPPATSMIFVHRAVVPQNSGPGMP